MALIIKWNNKTIKHFDDAIEYIRLFSPANAEKVKWEILSTIEGLREHPQKYNPDK